MLFTFQNNYSQPQNIRSLLCFDVSSWPVVKGWKKSCKVWFDCEFCELFSVKAGFEIAGEFSKTTEAHSANFLTKDSVTHG